MVTMIVQPPEGTELPAGIEIRPDVTTTLGQVPVLADVVVTPDGIASVNAELSVAAVALALPSVSVSVAVPPAAMEAGVMDLLSVGAEAVTVSGALAAGAEPTLVCSVPVVLVTAPGMDDVIVTMIVHAPAGMLTPDAMAICVAVTVTPVHVPVVAAGRRHADGHVVDERGGQVASRWRWDCPA